MTEPTKPIAPTTTALAKPSTEVKKPETAVVKLDAKPKPPDGPRFAYSLKIKVGNLEFHNLKGDFLAMPLIDLSTHQVGKVDFVINERSSDRNQLPAPPAAPTVDLKAAIADPKSTAKVEEKKADPNTPTKKTAPIDPTKKPATAAVKVDPKTIQGIDPKDALKSDTKKLEQKDDPESLWGKLKAQESAECQIELGFPGFLFNKLVGKLYRIGRNMPDGICLEIVDMSTMAQSTSPSVSQATDPNLTPTPKEEAKLGPDGKPIAIVGTDGNPLKPAVLLGADGKPIASSAIPSKADATKSPQKVLADAANSSSKAPPTPNAAIVAKDSGLKFELKSDAATGMKGSVATNTPAIKAAGTEAAKVGDAIVVDGNTIKQVAPGAGTPTGLILDWNQHKSAFIRKPTISKKTPNHLQGSGAIGVQGWDVNGKQLQQGFAVTPGAFTPVPGGAITVPEWGTLKMSDPIFPGCLYTWGDATKEGNRVPASKLITQGIIELARELMKRHGEGMNGGKKVQVNSWYRDPASNSAAGGSSQSAHLDGCAIDMVFPGMFEYFQKNLLPESVWNGGAAIMEGVFVHIDLGGISKTSPRSPRRRWTY